MKKLISSFAVLAASLGFATGAQAGTATSTLNVSFTAIAACTVSTIPVDFGSGTGDLGRVADGDVTVNCPASMPYIVALDAGLHYSLGSRHISDGTNFLEYVLYNALAGVQWGDSGHANTFPAGISLADTGSGYAQPHLVSGVLSSGFVPSGAYSDIVTVTVYY